MTLLEQHYIAIECCHDDCKERFRVQVEHPTDVQPSLIADDGEPRGYAIFRDKFLVQCPKCKRRACRILPGMVKLEIEKR